MLRLYCVFAGVWLATAACAQDAEIILEKGKTAYKTGDYVSALALFKQAIAVQPQLEEANYYAGMAEFSIGDYNEVIRYMQAEKILDDDNPRVYLMIAKAQDKLGKYDAAIGAMNDALALKKGNAKLLIERGNVLLDAKRYKEAISDYNSAQALSPELEIIFYKKGLCFYDLGETAAACENWRRLQDPDDYEQYELIERVCLRDVQK